MGMSIAQPPAHQPLAVLGKLTIAALVGSALLVASDLFQHGLQALVPVLILSLVVLIPAGIIAMGWRWAPLLGTLVYGVSLVLARSDIVYFLSRPNETYAFAFNVLFLALEIVGIGAGIGATVQNYRSSPLGSRPRTPRGLAVALAGLAGVCLGAILVAAIPQPGAAAGISPETLAGLPALATANGAFDQAEIRAKVGETVALRLENRDNSAHRFDIDAFNVHAPMPAGTSSLALLKATRPGTYTFYCGVPGHANQATGEGMVGKLIVTP